MPEDPAVPAPAPSVGAALLAAAAALAEGPCADLQAALRRAGVLLGALGPTGRGPAAALARREEYLVDAAALLRGELTRLAVALAAPAESDPDVALTRAREAVGYLGEISADLLPPGLCRALAAGPPGPDPALPAVLHQLRVVCDLAEQVADRAAAAAGASCGVGSATGERGCAPLAVRRGEIEALIAGLAN